MAKPVQVTKATNKNFAYRGTDRKGNVVKGEVAALNEALAKAQIRKQGINPTKVSVKSNFNFGGGSKITPMDICFFARQLATMMKAGVPLMQAFEIVSEGSDNKSLRELLISLKNDIAGGSNLAQALRKHPRYFDDRVATYKEKTELLKGKISKALKYPIAVVIVAAIVTSILLIKVVPVFKTLFEGFGAELPAFTQMVINLSNFVTGYWFIVLAIIVGSVVGIKEANLRSQKFRDTKDTLILKMPVIGIIIHKAAIARYSRTLATTFAAGVPLIEALESAAGASGNYVYRTAILKVKDDVATGQQLQFSMKNTGVFPSMVIQMVAIGEESGALDGMLDKVATYFEQEVDNAVDGLTSLLEPLIMAFLGVVVGGLVIAMYLPIFKLGAVV
jgi:type IV pilus assembly protein PilC